MANLPEPQTWRFRPGAFVTAGFELIWSSLVGFKGISIGVVVFSRLKAHGACLFWEVQKSVGAPLFTLKQID